MSTSELLNSDVKPAGTAPPRRPSVGCSSETAVATDVGSLCFSDSDRSSWHSAVDSPSGESSEIEGVSCPESHTHREPCTASDCEGDLESGELERKVHFGNEERNCRICHLNLVADGGGAMELGCDCKGDLGAAHKQCAETWFKIKGDTTCEICGSTAHNIAGEQTNDGNIIASSTNGAPLSFPEAHTRYNWQGRRIINILFGCTVLAFVISWLLHFKVLPS